MTKLRKTWAVGAAVVLAAGVSVLANSAAHAKSRKAAQGGGSGEIMGTVYFKGEAPRLRPIMMDKDPVCASLHPEGVLPEDGRVNTNGTLPNAFAYISKGAENFSGAAPTEPVTLTQNECEYVPHVLGIMVGQPLRVVSNDPTTHNIHIMPKAGHDFDVTQQPGSPAVSDKFSKPQIMVPVHCNIHNWMEAYIGVVTNPYYAVTGNDGTFQIKGVPAGSYTLSIWTATFGAQGREVTVRAGETASVDFTFGGR
ncbi:MAG TPA: carboxypeptidase regulatory-like domain-containing protein [Candidatus Acidoferrales bacterium]